MLFANIICVSVLFLANAAAKHRFIKLGCVKLYGKTYVTSLKTLLDAQKQCVKWDFCDGVRKMADNKFWFITNVRGFEVTGWNDDYILDYTNNTRFPRAPDNVDTYILFATYRNQTCPDDFEIVGDKCRYALNEKTCKQFAYFMEPSYQPAPETGLGCNILKMEDIIKKWQ
uniref:Uncharacterized protein n=1 Tax=Panagrolaimus sp. ES5 TaxID=591445 RepID=A0AC34FI38_9BILA